MGFIHAEQMRLRARDRPPRGVQDSALATDSGVVQADALGEVKQRIQELIERQIAMQGNLEEQATHIDRLEAVVMQPAGTLRRPAGCLRAVPSCPTCGQAWPESAQEAG